MNIITILHSDGQYPPEKINELIKPIEEGKAQAVSGSEGVAHQQRHRRVGRRPGV